MNEAKPSAAPTIGVDLGGTKILTALVGPDGSVISRDRRATDVDGGFDAVVAQIADAVQGLVDGAEGPVDGVGVGVAGQVRANDGVVTRAPNLDWDDAPLRSALEDALDRRVSVLNDVRAAAWGEWKHGAGRGSDDVTVVFVGTGVGGSVVSGGRVLTGATNMAGELGHLTVVAHGRECRCGNRGCLEAYAGGWAIAERAREAVAASPEEGAGLVARAGGMQAITAETVHDAMADGDPLAIRLVDETAGYLAAGLVGVINAFNPGTLVLGGGIVEHAPLYVDRVREHVIERALPAGARELRVVRAELGGRAGAVGAATFARTQRDDSNRTGSSG